MATSYTEDKKFSNDNFTDTPLPHATYDNCIFSNCDFSGADISDIIFIECEFTNCDFSNAAMGMTAFREVKFLGCKMLGIHFEECNPVLFSANYEGCYLQYSSFYKMKIKSTVFKDCNLSETDFTEADLSGALFEKCELQKAKFEYTKLEKADFSSAENYIIDPEINHIKKAKFSRDGVLGLLAKYDIEIG